jgi:DNA-directed RNA polymerase II subunit RPB2
MSQLEMEEPWAIIESYFKNHHLQRLVRHHHESYNALIHSNIEKTIDMFNPVNIRSPHDYDEESKLYSLELWVTFSNFNIYRPQIYENNGARKLMFPQEARLRNFTYSASMMIDLNIKIIRRFGNKLSQSETFYKILPKIQIGKIPVMLKSDICILKQYRHLHPHYTGECSFDAGGYFIINGSEKTVLIQERAAENRVYCFNVKKNNNKWSWLAEIKSVPDYKCISPKQINMTIATRNNGFGHNIYIQIPRIKNPVPLVVLFRALGVVSDKEICRLILLNIEQSKMKRMLFGMKASIIEAAALLTQEEALQHIISFAMFTPINMDKETGIARKRQFTIDVLNNDLFPHCGSKIQKIFFLGYMTNQLLQCSFGWKKIDDRDNYKNKRLDLTGALLNNLFRNYFNKVVKDMQKQVVREINNGSWRSMARYKDIINPTNVYKIIKSTTIENGLKRALATGDFGIKNPHSTKVGVAQVLNRLTYISTLSHLRRVNTPIDKSGKLIPPRKLHNSQWGYICPAESPEGAPIGVVKNLSYMSHVTIKSSRDPLYDLIKEHLIPLQMGTYEHYFDKVKVFINGAWVGIANDANKLYLLIKDKKYRGCINIYTSIIFNYRYKEIRICNDAGRLTRPLLRVKDGKLLLTNAMVKKIKAGELSWTDLLCAKKLKESVIEYIDAEEQNISLIAMTSKDLKSNKHYTHCEIHPSTIFGILASCIPFPEHNQSPRNTYQCAMGKQAMGLYATNFSGRMDKTSYILTYGARPLVDTRIVNLIRLNDIPSGMMVIVAIASFTGYNQEDSIIFNQEFIDRGGFSLTLYKTEKDEDKKTYGDEEIRCRPDPVKTKGMNFANYDKLNHAGIIPENTHLENKDVIIGKVVPIKGNRNDHTKIIKYSDQSKVFRTHEECYIDKNYVDRNGDGYTFCKVRTRTYRRPEIGDKFSSRHGQKGTIGIILPPENMPFSDSGIRPDIIINPHAIPSRMTIGQLKETLLGKVLSILGLFGDGTSFNQLPIDFISKQLLKNGFERNGNEVLMNGMTGEQIQSSIFIGPAFYQRLKHMVNDKAHSRSIGPMVVLTRQPAEGRSRDGGLRFGEMERDCMAAHGATHFTQERLYGVSDKYELFACRKCGMFAIFNNGQHLHLCKTCGNRVSFALIKIPYACKLLFQELTTMNIAPRIITDKA